MTEQESVPSYGEPFATLPIDAARKLRAIGPVWGTDIHRYRKLVVDTYTPIVAQARVSQQIEVEHDLPYGPHERQRLDVFRKGSGSGSKAFRGVRDVIVFVHGGAFIRGYKSFNGEIYDNVSYWFASRGFVAVNIEYRLAVDAPYPGGALDVARAVTWIRDNIASRGGNPERIFLIGHSAGGTHVATYLADPACNGVAKTGVSGAILIGGRLYADVRPENPNANGVREYFGEDQSMYDQRSPLTYADRLACPLMLVVAEFENPLLDQYGFSFADRVGRAHKVPMRFIQLRGHTHTSSVAHFNSGENYLGNEIVAFIAATTSVWLGNGI
ncbi:MAG TPA: alpha/beta hydrolase [Nevskiaceae bacterium]|nr:alpha/beta hydrolase [Nevskiaceae bacterium]